MRHALTLLIAALPVAAQAQSSPPLSDFSLPPAPQETATPRAQGPVDDSAPVPVAPRVIAPRPAATPTPVQRPVIQLPDAAPATAPSAPVEQRRPTARAAEATPQTQAEFQSSVSSGQTALPREAANDPPFPAAPPPLPLPAPEASSPTPLPAEALPQEQGSSLPVWAIGLLAIAAALVAALWWRRRQAVTRPHIIERPVVGGGRTGRGDASVSPEPLRVELTAVKLTRSFMNASLAYRVTLRSRSEAPLTGIAVASELVAAHGSQPLENQIASTAADLPQLHRVDRLAPGQMHTVEGTLTLPLSNVIPIRQGPAALFVPLLRLLVTADGAEPLARTFVVGLPGQGVAGRLQPFRLDEPPRSYAPVGQRALD